MKNSDGFGCFSTSLYHDLPRYPGPSESGSGVFLVAMQGEHVPGDSRGAFDRVHVMVVNPNDMADLSRAFSVLCALPALRPPAFASPANGLVPVRPRPVRGEILRSRKGQFYEKRGEQLVPLRNLASGAYGEVIEYGPPGAPPDSRPGVLDFADPVEGIYESEENTASAPLDVYPAESSTRESPPCRKLFGDPGQLRLVTLGDFRPQLQPQLKHPERLRETHRLACYVQVLEVLRPLRHDALASQIGSASLAYQLCLLDQATAPKLSLTEIPRPRVREFRRSPGWLLPGDRVCRLQLVRDPTSEADSQGSEQTTKAESVSSVAPSPCNGPDRSQKRTIPECYLKPWEFQSTRDEALYDMNTESGWLRGLRCKLRAWTNRSEFRRWQALLAGKSPDDQLWTVRPPSWGLQHPKVREWVHRMLAVAGYDTASMLIEWEIFWRRKGL